MTNDHDQLDLFGFPTPPTDTPPKPERPDREPAPVLAFTRTERRLIRTAEEIAFDDADRITYMHTVLCQTALPYTQLTDRRWQRRNGRVELEIEAGRVRNPGRGHGWINVPLPYGAKARLILLHLNAEAIRTRNRVIETDDSLTAFARNILGRPPNSRDIRSFKHQLTTLSAAQIRLALVENEETIQVDTRIVTAMKLWAPGHPDQRVLWPSTIKLGADYFDSLLAHAVPLDERAVAGLAHSALALDLYAWLAQRLHRIRPGRGQLVPWAALHQQFGGRYTRVRDFRRFLIRQLAAVHTQYPNANFETDERGLRLRHSTPPIAPRKVISLEDRRPR